MHHKTLAMNFDIVIRNNSDANYSSTYVTTHVTVNKSVIRVHELFY